MNPSDAVLRRRIKWLTWFFIVGLFLSGATAIPLESELNLLARLVGADIGSSGVPPAASGLAHWILMVRDALHTTNTRFPFMAYGTDWLAFGHFVIAIAFIGALRDPVRNIWLFTFGMIACVLLIPYAFVMGAVRGIPLEWGLIDCSFGIGGIVPVRLCRKWARELELRQTTKHSSDDDR